MLPTHSEGLVESVAESSTNSSSLPHASHGIDFFASNNSISRLFEMPPFISKSSGSSRVHSAHDSTASTNTNMAREILREVNEILREPENEKVRSDVVYATEKEMSRCRFERLSHEFNCKPEPFSVAFSGGGIRAAAFHCGVVWRLAERGRLKDVEHLSLVSGGSYVGTALMTFLLGNGGGDYGEGLVACTPPHKRGPEVIDMWYRRVVWQLISRMQNNAGFLIRFGSAQGDDGVPGPVKAMVTFAAVMLFAFVIIPATNFMILVAPLALLLEMDAGAELRLAWCHDATSLLEWTEKRLEYTIPFLVVAIISQAAALALRGRGLETAGPYRLRTFIIMLEVRYVAVLACVLIISFVCAAWIVLMLQITAGQNTSICTNASTAGVCSDQLRNGTEWYSYQGADFSPVRDAAGHRSTASVWLWWLFVNVLITGLGLLSSCLDWKIELVRAHNIVSLLSQMWAVFVGSQLLRWRIFLELETPDSADTLTFASKVLVLVVVIVLPLYGALRRIVHLYYARCLRTSFYHKGEDMCLREITRSLCPNVIIAATLVDYCRAADKENSPHFSEFFFTPLWMGGERTGFLSLPHDMKLSPTMAISSAASDTFLLTKMNRLWVRVILLALFNVFMGDYIEFRSSTRRGRWQARLQAFVVSSILTTFFVVVCLVDKPVDKPSVKPPNCDTVKDWFWTAWSIFFLLIGCSFFACFKRLRWLLSSPIIRHLHMAMMHYHTSPEPPLRLFLGDGGLVECLGLISLLRRRQRWMLVTDATADFSLQLVCLRETMKVAEAERLCTFYDPDNPRRGVEPLLQDFSKSQATHLRLGVLYDCWDRQCQGDSVVEPLTGEIFFLRMRLLNPYSRVGSIRITEEEVCRGTTTPTFFSGDSSSEMFGVCGRMCQGTNVASMYQEHVGGCCCDCCHNRCNCGLVGRFPDISTGNQFLTPTQFALLCRLGYQMSEAPIDCITRSQKRAAAES